MSKGCKRVNNYLTDIDPMYSLINFKGYKPKRDKKYKRLKYCIVCGSATYKRSGICSDKCLHDLKKSFASNINLFQWETGIIKK